MAFGKQQLFPNDLKPRVAIGVEIPFNGEGVFTSNYLTRDAVKNNLINYFLTNPGERPANPTFGAGIRKYIFQQLEDGTLDFLKEDIESKMGFFFPNVNLLSLDINKDVDFNTLYISLYYSIKNTNINDNIELTFS